MIVDTNILPAAAIGRLEVLKDGAAATYGSDAIAGVVNFITKKSFQGLEGERPVVRYRQNGTARELQADYIAGWPGVVHDCLSRLERGDGPPATPRDCARAVTLIFDAYRMAKEV